jgi:hypothetical protein
MIENPLSATIYIWEKSQPFNIDELLFVLGGPVAPTMQELQMHQYGWSVYCTQDYKIYPVTKEQNRTAVYYRWNKKFPSTAWYPTFGTADLERRLSRFGLGLPDHEICFAPREYNSHINPKKVQGAAAYLMLYSNLDLLCVPGTSIEENQYIASESIAMCLGIEMVSK